MKTAPRFEKLNLRKPFYDERFVQNIRVISL